MTCSEIKKFLNSGVVSTTLGGVVGNHRYRLEIPEPAPSLSKHGVSVGGIGVLPAIKITVIHQVCMYCGLSLKINTHETLHGARRLWMHFICIFLPLLWLEKSRICPTGAPWLTIPLHGVVKLAVKLVQSIPRSLWVQEVANSSPVSTNAFVKIEWTWNSLRQGTHC